LRRFGLRAWSYLNIICNNNISIVNEFQRWRWAFKLFHLFSKSEKGKDVSILF
jgi:hypothetical protein